MLIPIHVYFASLASWPMVSLLLVGFTLCQLGFGWRQKKLGCIDPPDVLGWYTPGLIRDLFETWGQKNRAYYAWTEVTLDLFFLLIYGVLFASLIAQLFQPGWWSWLPLVPLVCAAIDFAENSVLVFLVWTYRGQESQLVWFAACLTAVKMILFSASLLLLLLGGTGQLLGWL